MPACSSATSALPVYTVARKQYRETESHIAQSLKPRLTCRGARRKCMVELEAAHKDNTFTSGLALPKNRLQLQRGPVNLAAKFKHTAKYQSAVLAHHGMVAQLDGGGIGCRINLYPPQAGLH